MYSSGDFKHPTNKRYIYLHIYKKWGELQYTSFILFESLLRGLLTYMDVFSAGLLNSFCKWYTALRLLRICSDIGERQEAQILKFNAPPLHT